MEKKLQCMESFEGPRSCRGPRKMNQQFLGRDYANCGWESLRIIGNHRHSYAINAIKKSAFPPLEIPHSLLKMIVSWLSDRRAYVVIGETESDVFDINIGLPQGSSLSPYLFVVFHSDLIQSIGAHSGHLFADDLCVLIQPPLTPKFSHMIEYIEEEAAKVCNRIFEYSRKWRQPINVSKTVAQLFFTQIQETENKDRNERPSA